MSFDFSLADAESLTKKEEETKPAEPAQTEETKEENKKAAIDMSLDEIVKKDREERRAKAKQNGEKRKPKQHRNDRSHEKPKYKYLDLTEREIRNFTNQAELDTDGYDVKLRLVLTKKY